MKKLNQRIKELKKDVELAEEVEETSDGRAIVDITVDDLDDFYSPYSPKSFKLLNPQMVEYIDEYSKTIPASQELILRISATNKTDEAKNRIKKTIRRTFVEKIANINTELRRNLLSAIIFMAVGILFLAGVIIANTLDLGATVYEILDIIAWVFVWEAVDIFFMERHKKRVEKLRYAKLAVAEIEFV